jgi:hypothetical protein
MNIEVLGIYSLRKVEISGGKTRDKTLKVITPIIVIMTIVMYNNSIIFVCVKNICGVKLNSIYGV